MTSWENISDLELLIATLPSIYGYVACGCGFLKTCACIWARDKIHIVLNLTIHERSTVLGSITNYVMYLFNEQATN